MQIAEIVKLAQVAGPFALAGFATVVLLKERSRRSEKDTDELKANVNEFVKEFRNCISILSTTSERQAVLQKVTNDTMLSLINKFELLEDRVNVSATKIAILEQKDKRHG